MSANIPFEIEEEIIKRVLPVKSLIRFRSVSKQWKSLIDSVEFITHHTINQTHQNHLLVRYTEGSEYKYISVVDDDSFPQHKFSPGVSPTVKLLSHASMLDCSHGLVCLYEASAVLGKRPIFLWNPSIRKSIGIVCPSGFLALGFGVCPKTSDPKIVTISRTSSWTWKADVFTLSSGSWKSISLNIQMPHNEIGFCRDQVVIDGIIYWSTSETKPGFILSFDLTTEEFRRVDLPENLARHYMSISNLKESLVVVQCDEYEIFLDVLWMMIKNGDSNFSFEKLYTLSCFADDGCEVCGIIGFTKNGQPIRDHICEANDSVVSKLEAYELSTRSSSDLGIYVNFQTTFKITHYTESLLLLNHSESIIHGR